MKGASLLNTAVQKLPSSMKKLWSLFTFQNKSLIPKLLDFNECLKQKSRAHELIKQTLPKIWNEDITSSLEKKSCVKTIAANTQTKGTVKIELTLANCASSRCFFSKGNHSTRVFWYSLKTLPLSKAKMVAETKLSVSRLKDKLLFRQCLNPKNIGTMVATALKTQLFKKRKAFSTRTPNEY